MELDRTIELMLSENYQDRFKAEYYQLLIRRDKLQRLIDNWDYLSFDPVCSKVVFESQIEAMDNYLFILDHRAHIENIIINRKEIE